VQKTGLFSESKSTCEQSWLAALPLAKEL